MIDLVLMTCAVAISAAFVCRVDILSWRWHPLLMSVHVAGGVSAAWVLKRCALGVVVWSDVVLLACSALLLVATYRLIPPPGCKVKK